MRRGAWPTALKGTPQALIKEHFSALEEGRADLVGLYFIADPKLVELGIIPAADQDDIVRAEYEAYTRNALVQLRRVREGTQIEEDHMRNRQMIVRWLMANTKAIEERTRDGKTLPGDGRSRRRSARASAGCWPRCSGSSRRATTRRRRSCSRPTASTSIRSCATRSCARVDKLNLPSYTGFVMPKLTPVTDAKEDHRRDDLVSDGPDDADAGVSAGAK